MTGWLERRFALAAAVGALSLLAHAKGLTAPLRDYHVHRQVNTAAIARNYYRESRPFWRPRVDWEGPEDRMAATELPLQMWLFGRLWPVFGLGEIWGRLISVACSLLTALLLFALLRRELGNEAGFYGACVFSLLPLEVYFGRSVQPEAMALLGLVGGLYFWELSLGAGRPWSAWAAATACATAAVGLKLPYAHMFVPLAALTWRRLGRAALVDWRTWAAGALAAAGVGAWFSWASSGVYVVPTHGKEFWSILGWDRLPYFTQFLLLSRFPELAATYAGLPLFLLGAREQLWRRRELFWLAFFGAPLLHLLALGEYAHQHEYSALPLLPATAGLIGLGLARLRERAAALEPPRRAAAYAGLLLLALAIPAHTALRIGHWYRQGDEYLLRAGEAAEAVSRPDEPYFTNCRAASIALYYLDRRGWTYELDRLPAKDALAMIDRYARQGARLLATEKRGHFAEPDGALWKALSKRGKPAWDDGRLAVFRLKGSSAGRSRSSAPAGR